MKSIKNKIYNILKIVDYNEFNRNINKYNTVVNKYNNLVNKYNNLSMENTDFKTVIFKENPNIYSEEYIEKSNRFFERHSTDPKLIAFYLPQFHSIKENDEWWGEGFTEWTNVTKAQPQFVGHYQPHLPDELGFYDLNHNDIFYKQIELAKKYGIYGFCFHYYWFSGKRLLEKPIFNFLNDKNLDLPFMLCWANEPWSRRWDGSENDILIDQNFEKKDHLKFIKDIIPFFKDERYIKIDNCPILIIYRPHYISKEDMNEAIGIWNDYIKQEGFDGLYLLNTRTGTFDASPSEWGLDATIEFPPNRNAVVPHKNLSILNPNFVGRIYNLAKTIDKTENLPSVDYTVYKTVMPAWDNTARKKNDGTIYFNSSPELYKKWLFNCILHTKEKHPDNKQLIFINAWNEWAEGAHLEPDQKYGLAYLEATLDAIEDSRINTTRYGLEDHYYPLNVHEVNYEKVNLIRKIGKKVRKPLIKNPYIYMILKSKGNIKKFLLYKKSYSSLKESDLFDELYYSKKYSSVKRSGMDPLLHYIFFGYKDGKLPSFKFDGDYYLNTYENVKKSGFNPLVHYLLYGKDQGKIIKSNSENHKFAKYSDRDLHNIYSALKSKKKVIILYIYNDYKEAKRTIKSVLENTRINYELLLIDDFSTDNKVNILLNELNKNENITVINNKIHLGFLKSVNIGIEKSEGDVVLIKSNTIVSNHWLQKMVVAAYSNEKIGTVIPFSDNIKFLSDIITKTIGVKLNPNEIAYLIENVSEHLKPEIKYPDESCLYIKRKTIKDVGLLDEQIRDIKKAKKTYYKKILDNDSKNIIDDSTYVYRNGESFDKDYNSNIELSPKIEKIKRIIRIRSRDQNLSIPKKRVLYVLHENIHGVAGGTGQTTKDILDLIDDDYECFILVPSVNALHLWKREQNQLMKLRPWKTSRWSLKDINNEEFRNIYLQILIGLNIDLVHIQHLIGHTFDLPVVAKTLGIPTILSFHDFYYVCPSIHLLDHNNQYCAGHCTGKNHQCYIYTDKIFNEFPILKDYIDIWRNGVSQLIDNCTAFTAPTESTKDLYVSIYPKLDNKPFNVIEHGRDFEKTKAKYELPSKNEPIKILVPGNIKYHKGHDFIKELKKNDHENKLEFHFMGTVYNDLKEIGIYHGKYDREDFCKIVDKINPTFIGIFSICPETYCHTLTESWSCGIPVLATKIGALKERIIKNGGGWLINHESPLEAYNEIIKIANSVEDYLKVAKEVSDIKFKSKKEMVNEYRQLYKTNLEIKKV